MPKPKRKKRRSPSLSSEDIDSLDIGSLSGSEFGDAGDDKKRRQSGRSQNQRRKRLIVVEEFCVFCYGTEVCNDEGNPEELLRCSECLKYAHPSCLEMPEDAVSRAKRYDWQCNDCKGCIACRNKENEEAIILCDACDRGFHTYCAGLHHSPDPEASWLCPVCQGEEFEIGSNAGFSDISDSRSDRISVWKEVKGTEQLDRSDEMSISTERGRRLLSERSQRLSSSSFEVAAEGALEETGSGDLDESEQGDVSKGQQRDQISAEISVEESENEESIRRRSFAESGKETIQQSNKQESTSKELGQKSGEELNMGANLGSKGGSEEHSDKESGKGTDTLPKEPQKKPAMRSDFVESKKEANKGRSNDSLYDRTEKESSKESVQNVKEHTDNESDKHKSSVELNLLPRSEDEQKQGMDNLSERKTSDTKDSDVHPPTEMRRGRGRPRRATTSERISQDDENVKTELSGREVEGRSAEIQVEIRESNILPGSRLRGGRFRSLVNTKDHESVIVKTEVEEPSSDQCIVVVESREVKVEHVDTHQDRVPEPLKKRGRGRPSKLQQDHDPIDVRIELEELPSNHYPVATEPEDTTDGGEETDQDRIPESLRNRGRPSKSYKEVQKPEEIVIKSEDEKSDVSVDERATRSGRGRRLSKASKETTTLPKGETEEVLDKKLVDTDVSNDDQETIATDVERRLLHGRSGQRKSDAEPFSDEKQTSQDAKPKSSDGSEKDETNVETTFSGKVVRRSGRTSTTEREILSDKDIMLVEEKTTKKTRRQLSIEEGFSEKKSNSGKSSKCEDTEERDISGMKEIDRKARRAGKVLRQDSETQKKSAPDEKLNSGNFSGDQQSEESNTIGVVEFQESIGERTRRGRGRPPNVDKVPDVSVDDKAEVLTNSSKQNLKALELMEVIGENSSKGDEGKESNKQTPDAKTLRRRSIRHQESADIPDEHTDTDAKNDDAVTSSLETSEPSRTNRASRGLSRSQSLLVQQGDDEVNRIKDSDPTYYDFEGKSERLSETKTEIKPEQISSPRRASVRGRGKLPESETVEDSDIEEKKDSAIESKTTATENLEAKKSTKQTWTKTPTEATAILQTDSPRTQRMLSRNQREAERFSEELEGKDDGEKMGVLSQDNDFKTPEKQPVCATTELTPVFSDRKSYPKRERKPLHESPTDVAKIIIKVSPEKNIVSRTPTKKRKLETTDKSTGSAKKKLKTEEDVTSSIANEKARKTPEKATPSKTPKKTKEKEKDTPKKSEAEKKIEKTTPASKRKREAMSSPEVPKKKSKTDKEKNVQKKTKIKMDSPEKEKPSAKPPSGSSMKKNGKKVLTDLDGDASASCSKKDSVAPASARSDRASLSREPATIESFVSEADMELFREAQAKVKDMMQDSNKENLEETKGTKIVEFGQYEIDTWYPSPYPSEYNKIGKVFVCEFCLKYMKSATILRRHMAKCCWRHPPGDEIYRKDDLSVFEVDGEKSKAYCQNLCLFAKLFLDHKTLYYEVEPFLFYVMTRADCYGCHLIGYFSKEKTSFLNYNVSCILVLPHFMKKGYGKMLIDFSYLLSRVEGKLGSPERPLSDLGLISYRSYWKDIILKNLSALDEDRISIKDVSVKTGVHSNDLISTLQALGLLKYYKGKHIILLQQDMIQSYLQKKNYRESMQLEIYPEYLQWTPKEYGQSRSRTKNK